MPLTVDDGDCAIANACRTKCDVSFLAPKLMYTIYSRTPSPEVFHAQLN